MKSIGETHTEERKEETVSMREINPTVEEDNQIITKLKEVKRPKK